MLSGGSRLRLQKEIRVGLQAANKLVAICAAARDSAVLHERAHCVRGRRPGTMKGSIAEGITIQVKITHSRLNARMAVTKQEWKSPVQEELS